MRPDTQSPSKHQAWEQGPGRDRLLEGVCPCFFGHPSAPSARASALRRGLNVTTPDWRTSKKGTRVRVALWLVQEVGEGNVFTKADLRDAFPGVEQVDRRMRDLRAEGWRILTNLQDPTLASDELRFASAGSPVWEAASAKTVQSTVSSRQRQVAFARDGYMCTICGVGGGEAYPDAAHLVAVLSVRRVGDDLGPEGLVTVCTRCLKGDPAQVPEVSAVQASFLSLSPVERALLRTWIRRGQRTWSSVDRIYAVYRHLSPPQQAIVREYLNEAQ